MKRSILTSILLIGAFTLQAQDPNVGYVADSIITPQFFIAVIAGVLLAMGFQFILTALSVALGITAIGDLKEKYVHSKNHPDNKKHYNDEPDDNDSGGMSTGTMVTTGFGVWSAITVGLSLFGATALAINLSLIASTVISITLGLVIWATFFILMFYLESRVVNTLVGGLINTATAGLRASGEAVKSMVTPSKEHQMKNVAEDTVETIRKDFQSSFDPHVINDTIDEFFTRMDRSVPDYEQVKNDIREIVEETSQQEKSQDGGGGGGSNKWMAMSQVMSNAISQSSEGGGENQGKVEQLKTLQKELKQAYDQGETEEEKIEKVVAKLTPAEEEQVHSYIQKIKQLISQATPEDMERGNLKNQVMQVVKNPKENTGRIWSKIGEMDRDSIVSLLEKNTALKRDQIEKYADKIMDMMDSIKAELGGSETSTSGDGEMSELQKKVQLEVTKFMNNTGKSDLNFAMLTSLFQGKLDDQKENLKSLKTRLQNMDKDSLKAMVINNTRIDQKDIDKVVQSIEDAKNNVLDKINKIEDEANRRVENMKRKAVIEAEATRKNAAAAAWWVVASAVISAGAAIGGSLVALA